MMFAKNKLRLIVAAALIVCAAGASHAQSPWKALAQAIVPANKQQAQQPQQPQQQKPAPIAMVSDPSVGVSHGRQGVKPNAEFAAAQVRSAISAIGDRIPTIQLNLGSELEETTVSLAVDLFKDPEIRKLLGDGPRFIYDPNGKADPMVVPWVRRAAMIKELLVKADAFAAAGQIDQSVNVYKQILAMKDQRFAAIVQQKLGQLDQQAQIALKTESLQISAESIELPVWVHDNTTGVLLDKQNGNKNALCLVGEHMLHVGESVPDYPEITVASIGEKSVTYRYRSRVFKVELNTN